MNLKQFSKINLARCVSVAGFNHPLHSWSPAEWTNAVAGEAGEAANITKKMLRYKLGIHGNIKPEDQDYEVLRQKAIKELADVVIYCDLAIQALGGDTSQAITSVFNKKSFEIGCSLLIEELDSSFSS